jgi:hypothetical protein
VVPFTLVMARALACARYTAQSFSSYGRGVPSGRIVVDAAVAHVQAIDDGVAYRRNDPPTHKGYVVTGAAAGNARPRVLKN